MKRQIISMAMAAVMVLSLAGCSGTNTAAAGKTADTKAEETAISPAETESAEEVTETVSESAEESEKPDFIVGFDKEFPPMGFVDENGEYTGFDLELAAEAADRMGMTFKAQPIAWDSKDMELEAGTIDCIWNGFTMTGREEEYTWTKPYMENSQVIVVRKDSGIASEDDLAGKNVEVQTDSTGLRALEAMPELMDSFGSLNQVADYNTAFMDLEMGAADAVVMDVIVAGYQMESRGEDAPFVILDDSISTEEYAGGFKLGNTELRDKVQAALDDMYADGTMKQISEKWFGKDITISE